jgi:hypothetical protein
VGCSPYLYRFRKKHADNVEMEVQRRKDKTSSSSSGLCAKMSTIERERVVSLILLSLELAPSTFDVAAAAAAAAASGRRTLGTLCMVTAP